MPNPTMSEFKLEVKSSIAQTIDIIVVNVAGQTVYRTRGDATSTYTFGQGFAPGAYIVQIIHQRGIKVIKVVKL